MSFSSPLELPMHSGAISTGPTSSDCDPSMPSSDDIYPSDSQGSPLYTSGFFTDLGTPGSLPIPRLRPASWDSSPQVDEAFESRRSTRRPSVDFRGSSSGEEEDLPFGGRTLPPLPILNDPWYSGGQTAPNIISTFRDHSPDNEDLSATNSLHSTSSPTDNPDKEYR